MARLQVQHCVLNMTTRQYGPHPTSDLLGVDYYVTIPADLEFPRTLSRVDLFVRFFARLNRTVPIQIGIDWLNPDGTPRQRVNTYQIDVPFLRMTPVLDRAFRLVNVFLPGRGTYAITVHRQRRHRWRGDVWKRLAVDWFEVR